MQPPGNSNSRRTRQRFDSFALAQASLAQASNANESPARRTSRNLPLGTPFALPLYKSPPIDEDWRLEHNLPDFDL